MTISIDFETRSVTGFLREVGVYKYAEDETTDVWCMAYKIDDGPVEVWTPGDHFPFEGVVWSNTRLFAWNANFERVIWNLLMTRKYGWPAAPLEMWHDTQAAAANLALPRSLEKCAKVLGTAEKDTEGRRIMLQMEKPRRIEDDGEVVWWDSDPSKHRKLLEYCKQDVRVEYEIGQGIWPALIEQEHRVWQVDARMNDRGVALDREAIQAAIRLVDEEMDYVNLELWSLTDGRVSAITNHQAICEWVNECGLETKTVKRSYLEDLLAGEVELPAEHADQIRRVAELRIAAGRTSTSKLDKMLKVPMEVDGRARGLTQYYGADTGRWSGRLIQPQNLPRGEVDADERLFELIVAEDLEGIREEYGEPLIAISSALRGMFVAGERKRFACVDYSAIEARVLAWLAGQEDLLELFREGKDVYVDMAESLGSDSRPFGKVTILGAGYQMGWETFRRHAAGYGLDLSEKDARHAIRVYREKNNRIRNLWSLLKKAALLAVKRPGDEIHAGEHLSFVVEGWFLWMKLPSGRKLAYASPEIVLRSMPWDPQDRRPSVRVWHMNSQTYQWGPRHLYGGLLAENATQAVARDVMVDGILALEESDEFTPLMTIHDEILCETTNGTAERMAELMVAERPWREGLPIAADGWEGQRYRKD